jgi:HK97 family phage major capsid protein
MSDNLRNRLEVIQKDASAIQAASKAAGKDVLDVEEATQFDAKMAEFDAVEAQIKREERAILNQAKLSTPQPRPVIEVVDLAPRATAANGGFKSLSEFAKAVRAAAYGHTDPRLIQGAVTTYGGENVGPDGGFSVPTDYRNAIIQAWEADDNLMRLFSPITTNSNLVTLVTDETTPHGTSGITAAWLDEMGTITPTKPVLKTISIPIRRVAALVHLSEELLEDSAVMSTYVAKKMGAKISSAVSDAIINGDGNGKPLGIANSPALVSVTRTTAHKVKMEDVSNMVSRLRPGSFGKAFWLCHSSVLPQLLQMVNGTFPIYQPDFTKSPYGTLLGRPIYVSEYCLDLTATTAVGDMYLINPDGYVVAVKSSGLSTASTVSFAFDQAATSFRAMVRVGGQGLLSAAISRKSGTDTLSDFVGISHI